MCCCCPSLHRHQIHLISYGCVSFGLITTGLVFTVFAIFQKDSQIGKVWLAGPTTMVVGLVLCGKVIIDWGPAMMHGREGSIDSRLDQHMAQQMILKQPQPYHTHPHHASISMPGDGITNSGIVSSPHHLIQNRTGLVYTNTNVANSPPCAPPKRNGTLGRHEMPVDCIIYSQYDAQGTETASTHHSQHSTQTSSSATIVSPEHSVNEGCDCKYGSMRRPPHRTVYQGESFVMNERSFLI